MAPILAAYFRGNILAGNTLYIDPVAGFITALLPVLKEKVDLTITQISQEPEYLSKFIAELLEFDEAIRARFNYDGEMTSCFPPSLGYDSGRDCVACCLECLGY